MIKPRITPPGELEKARKFLAEYGPGAVPHHATMIAKRRRAAEVVAFQDTMMSGDRHCSRCRQYVDLVDSEPIAQRMSGTELVSTTVAYTLTPCGHTFTKVVAAG